MNYFPAVGDVRDRTCEYDEILHCWLMNFLLFYMFVYVLSIFL